MAALQVGLTQALELMGPLFLLATMLFAALALSFGAFLIARIFRMSRPLFVAFVFPFGAVLGAVVAVLFFAIVFGSGTLTTSSQVMGYLAFLGISSLTSGALAVWCCKRVLTFSSTGRATRAG